MLTSNDGHGPIGCFTDRKIKLNAGSQG